MGGNLGEGMSHNHRPWRIRALFRLWGLPIAQASRELRAMGGKDPEALRQWRKAKAWEIARYHYDHNPWYQKKVGPRFPDAWDDLPILGRKDFQAPIAARRTRFKGPVYRGATSGSSGQPMVYLKDMYAHAMTWALIEDRYRESGIDWSLKQGRFYGMPRQGRKALMEKIKDWLLGRSRFSVEDLGNDRMAEWWDRLQKEGIDYLYGYTSVISHFSQWIAHQGPKAVQGDGFQPLKRIRQVVVTSETCHHSDREAVRNAWGMDPIREYGISEICLVGFDRKGRFDLNQETLWTEVSDEQGQIMAMGQEGQITLTSLYNRAYPMVRYQPGDRVRLGQNRGRIFIDDLLGRESDFIALPGGRRAAGLNFYYLAQEMLTARYPISQFRVRQTQIGSFEMDYVADRPLSPSEQGQIAAWVSEILAHPCTVALHYYDQLPPHPLGKRQHFFSEMIQP